ncbi:hypothetical protein ACJX0J_014844, partial [Zea mays]
IEPRQLSDSILSRTSAPAILFKKVELSLDSYQIQHVKGINIFTKKEKCASQFILTILGKLLLVAKKENDTNDRSIKNPFNAHLRMHR